MSIDIHPDSQISSLLDNPILIERYLLYAMFIITICNKYKHWIAVHVTLYFTTIAEIRS